jgi:hypothetical protein
MLVNHFALVAVQFLFSEHAFFCMCAPARFWCTYSDNLWRWASAKICSLNTQVLAGALREPTTALAAWDSAVQTPEANLWNRAGETFGPWANQFIRGACGSPTHLERQPYADALRSAGPELFWLIWSLSS